MSVFAVEIAISDTMYAILEPKKAFEDVTAHKSVLPCPSVLFLWTRILKESSPICTKAGDITVAGKVFGTVLVVGFCLFVFINVPFEWFAYSIETLNIARTDCLPS